MKKKIMALCLVAILAITAIGGATLAYFTDTSDVAENTFAVGDVQIKLDEAKVDEKGIAQPNEDRVLKNDYRLYPGMTYDKDPTVTVLAKSEPCYVRMKLTISNQAALDAAFASAPVRLDTILTGGSEKWELKSETEEGDARIYEFWYKDIVTVGDSDLSLEPLFQHIVISKDYDNATMAAFNGMKINVVADAIQAEGLATAEAAWAAFDA